jgi:tetratricopeptide (TPR) repeat protein
VPPPGRWRTPADAVNGFLTPDDEERLVLAARQPFRLDRTVVDALSTILAAQRHTEDVIGSGPLIAPVTAQAATIEGLVIDARGDLRTPLVDVASQWAEFLGWLHTSRGDAAQAGRWFDRAGEWAGEAGNATMAATVLSFKGHLAFLVGQIGPAVGLSRAAQRDPAVWIGQRAYDAHQEARGLAVMGDPEAARRLGEAAEMAEKVEESRDETPPWIYYYTAPFYKLERGWVCRYLGRDDERFNSEAIRLLSQGLDELGEDRRSEWAAEYVYHLAFALYQGGDAARASTAAGEAATVALAMRSDPLLAKLRRLHTRLAARWPRHPDVTVLGELLHYRGPATRPQG